MKIYFIRHGFAYHNLGATLYGDVAYNLEEYKDAKLTPVGIEQAILAGKKLEDINFTKLYCSPSIRCIETISNVLNQNEDFLNNKIIINIDDRLMEPQGYHICNKRKDKNDLIEYLKQYSKNFDLRNVSEEYKFNYETKQMTQNKITNFINFLKQMNNDNDTILISTHYDWLYNFFEMATGKGIEFSNCEFRIVILNNFINKSII
jgi:broad specificity phosphatase PhoE